MRTTTTRMLGVLVTLTIGMPAVVAGQERVGVATTVIGPVTVNRVATAPAPLKFKDDVLLNDRVVTGENAFARMLLGGKAIVTAREHSVVTITEVPGVSTVELLSGRISVAVDKARMRRGDVVEIKTPNAVSGIRGTIVVAEVTGGVSTITVLRGLVDVYRRDPKTGNAVGRPTPLSPRESVTVKAGVLPARPQPISTERARTLANDFTAPIQPLAPSQALAVDEMSRAAGALTTATSATTGALATTNTLTNSTLGSAPTLSAAPTLSTTPTLSTVPTLSTAPALPTTPTIPTAPTLSTTQPLSTVPSLITTPVQQVVPKVTQPTTTLPNPNSLLR